ncbi:MAG: DNA polymerase III subunit alpha, partial [Rhodobiaceae bacterium]|nr:DNA polymerase III subunit alpha [Rhodobiaceae bacterium]
RALESLAAAGAFDTLEPNRAAVHASCDRILGWAAKETEDRRSGQGGLFGATADISFELTAAEPWLPADRLSREFESVGFFLSGHPLDDYEEALRRARVKTYAAFKAAAARGAAVDRIAGVVTGRQEKRGRKGSRYGIVTLSDPTGQYEVFVFSEVLAANSDMLTVGERVIVSVEGEMRNGELRLTLAGCERLDKQSSVLAASLRIFLDDAGPIESIARRLTDPGDGRVSVILRLDAPCRDVEIDLPGGYQITPQISGAIKAIAGVASVETV